MTHTDIVAAVADAQLAEAMDELNVLTASRDALLAITQTTPVKPQVKKRGRPKGSKNKASKKKTDVNVVVGGGESPIVETGDAMAV